jgi:hypothetical protein
MCSLAYLLIILHSFFNYSFLLFSCRHSGDGTVAWQSGPIAERFSRRVLRTHDGHVVHLVGSIDPATPSLSPAILRLAQHSLFVFYLAILRSA